MGPSFSVSPDDLPSQETLLILWNKLSCGDSVSRKELEDSLKLATKELHGASWQQIVTAFGIVDGVIM